MDQLAKGSVWLQKMQRKHASQAVSYRRGESSITVPATIGRSTFQTDDGSGLLVNSETRDYLIAPADLTLDDVQVEPAVGDKVVETDEDGVEYQYRVMAPNAGEPPWRWADQYRNAYRIHTKFLGTSPTSTR